MQYWRRSSSGGFGKQALSRSFSVLYASTESLNTIKHKHAFCNDTPDQNLRRAKAQLALFQDMMAHKDDMKQIIREVAARG